MAFLLKIAEAHFNPARTFVAERLSDRGISDSEVGAAVFVWFTDSADQPSRLVARWRLAAIEQSTGPQRRDPSKTTNGYAIRLSDRSEVVRALSTDDLGPFRDDPESSPMHPLGKLHDNRNEKLRRVPEATVSLLACRF